MLSGTGGDEWRVLFDAARAFAVISHADQKFPELHAESTCPLCQNVLGDDGANRLVKFDEFIRQAAEATSKAAREVAAAAYKAIQNASLDIVFRDGLVEELAELNAPLSAGCFALQESLKARQQSVLDASAGRISWDVVLKISEAPAPQLAQIVIDLQAQATALEATADEKLRASMMIERNELNARVRLLAVKDSVLEAIAKHELCRRLQVCIGGMDTRGISRKSTELSRSIASQDLADALNEEFQRLKVHHLKIVMKPESPAGRTTFKLVLQLPGGGTPSAILSEGEQRAIAIASFLAEVKLGRGRGGIVLDDPVSSLDHRRRWEVAERLALESLTRQVIVFTHDIYFLCILEQKSAELNATLTKNYIRRTSDGFGVHASDLPFDVLGTKERIARLRQELVEIRRAVKDGNDDGQRRLTTSCYGRLRLAWERSVEEVLFNGVVQRFGEGVSTMKLKSVVVTDDDYRVVEQGMTKCSKFEHDAASPVGRLPLPEPDELEQDIGKLSAWRDLVNKRNDVTRGQR
nr:AAA family ATPase [Pseudomonas sp. PDM27]